MDPLDVDLEDPELLGEVELTAALIVAANQTNQQLSAAEIDAVLGIAVAPETVPPSEAPQPQ